MKFECARKELADALSHAGQAASNRSAFPILTTLLVEANEHGVTILGCDGELWVERKVLAAVDVSGAVCMQARLLQDIVSALPDGQVDFELNGTIMDIRHGGSDWKIPVLPSDQFPKPAEVEPKSSLKLRMGDLRDAVSSVSYAVADDASRPVLTGVLINYDGNELTLVATDTHRLAVRKVEKPGIGSEVNAIVPEKAFRSLKSMPLSDDEEVTVNFDETRLRVDAGDCVIVCQLLSGVFPNWERVVPQDFTRAWIMDRAELFDNIKRAMIIAKDNANRIRFSGRDEQVLISARTEDKGEAKEVVAAVTKNGEIDIAFNGSYVMQALGNFKGDGIRAEMTEPSRPAVFREVEEGDHHFCVIMPMALG